MVSSRTPRGRTEREESAFETERRGRQLLRDVGKDPVDVPGVEVSSGGNELAELTTIVKRIYSIFTWWSDTQETVTFTTAAAVKSLPDVVIVDLPADAVVQRVIAVFKFRQVEDTSAVLNDLNAACGSNIEMRETGGTFIDAINLVDQQFQVPASERGPGDVLFGDVDLTCELNSNTTYNFQFESVASTGSSLILRDVQCGLQIVWK